VYEVDVRPADRCGRSDSEQCVYPRACIESPVGDEQLMERVVERENMYRALRRVEKNRGAPGVDGMEVEKLRDYLMIHWPDIKEQLLAGKYKPSPVRRVEIPKSTGGKRKLGIPTAMDRLIQQALLQVLQPFWNSTFSEASFGFRPGRSAHQAVVRAQRYLKAGYSWVVDIDLEKFFDQVNHDKLMGEVHKSVTDNRVLCLIRSYLKAGAVEDGALHESLEGTPQGGPLSPLLANLLLDCLDREMTGRGHRFVRYADDCNIYVRSRRAGIRVLRNTTKYLSVKLKLKVNMSKSAVDRPWNRKFLGFSFTRRRNRCVSEKAVKAFKDRVRIITRRTRGRRIERVIEELRRYMVGWRAYFGFAEVRSLFKELDSWVKRRLRCYQWKQWGRRGYRELVKRGVSRDLAWNTFKSAHGPWRLSRSPGLAFALTAQHFATLGLPRLYVKPT
jgi:RNA-directed DNA polymerase